MNFRKSMKKENERKLCSVLLLSQNLANADEFGRNQKLPPLFICTMNEFLIFHENFRKNENQCLSWRKEQMKLDVFPLSAPLHFFRKEISCPTEWWRVRGMSAQKLILTALADVLPAECPFLFYNMPNCLAADSCFKTADLNERSYSLTPNDYFKTIGLIFLFKKYGFRA